MTGVMGKKRKNNKKFFFLLFALGETLLSNFILNLNNYNSSTKLKVFKKFKRSFTVYFKLKFHYLF